MKKLHFRILLFVLVLQLLTIVSSGQDKFDIVTFKIPTDWQKQVTPNSLGLMKTDGKGGNGMINIFKSVPVNFGVKFDFLVWWKEVVRKVVNTSENPQMQPTIKRNGWTMDCGIAQFTSENKELNLGKGMALLCVVRGGNELVNVLALSNSKQLNEEVFDFLDSIQLPANNSSKLSADKVTEELTNLRPRISLFNNQVSFILPQNFKPLTRKKLKKKLPDNSFPKYIFSNPDQTGLVFIYLEDFNGKLKFTPDDLPEVKNFVEGIHRNYSSWIISEITQINGDQWFHFEWETPKHEKELVAPLPPGGEKPAPTPVKTNSHYQEYSTSFKNKLFRVVFEADVKKYEMLKDGFTESSRTIKIKK